MVDQKRQHYICNFLVVPKPSGDFRFIFNLKPLNKFIRTEHFKMKGVNVLREIIRPNVFSQK